MQPAAATKARGAARAPGRAGAIPARAATPAREARGRGPALRRRHQRRRRAARALHRRAPVAPRGGRGRHDVRARLRHLAQRAGRPASSRSTASPCAGFRSRHERHPDRLRPAARAASSSTRIRIADELAWLESEGPASPALVNHVGPRRADLDFVLLFSYRYYHAWHGARRVPAKAVLVPTAERDPAIGAVDLRPDVPRRARPSCTTRTKSAR